MTDLTTIENITPVSFAQKVKSKVLNTIQNPEVRGAAGLAALSIGTGVLLGVASSFSSDEDEEETE